MSQILHCNWLPKQARWRFLAHAGLQYVLCSTRKIFPIVYSKCFIDQVFSFKMARYWPHSSFSMFLNRDGVEVHQLVKQNNELGQYPSILIPRLVNNPYIK